MRPLVKIIDLAALRHNLALLQAKATPAKLMAVVKADAYGHGVENILTGLTQVAQLAVACIEEAIRLRELGAKQPIVLLEGVFEPQELSLCRAYDFVPLICHQRQLDWLAKETEKYSSPLAIWLKVDSGMHRLGFSDGQLKQVIARVQSLDSVRCLGVATHFACADEEDLTHTRGQLALMNALDYPSNWQRCYANSPALLQLSGLETDWVRAGLALYGISPIPRYSAAELNLHPVMTLQTQILDTHYLRKGDSAGYAQGFVASTAGNIATIALGYGDGFPHRIDNASVQVRINHKNYPIVGRVAMDMSLVWLADDNYDAGTTVTIWSGEHPIEIRAQEARTIPYVLTTSLTSRVHTRILNG